PRAACASVSDRAAAIRRSATFTRRRASASSPSLASRIVHVTSDAKARLIITPLTKMSADRNIDHGDSSRGIARVGGSPRLASLAGTTCASFEVASAGADGSGAGVVISDVVGADGCWLRAGCAAPSAISATRTERQLRQRDVFMLWTSHD